MRRAFLLAAALAIPVTGVTTVALSTQAWAGTKIVCTSVSGSATTTVTISGCTGGNTGGKSQPLNGTALATGGTVTWISGSTTTLAAPTLVATSAKKCPGYVKGGSTNPIADKASVVVTGDNGDGIKVPGKASGSLCIAHDGSVSALKPFKIS